MQVRATARPTISKSRSSAVQRIHHSLVWRDELGRYIVEVEQQGATRNLPGHTRHCYAKARDRRRTEATKKEEPLPTFSSQSMAGLDPTHACPSPLLWRQVPPTAHGHARPRGARLFQLLLAGREGAVLICFNEARGRGGPPSGPLLPCPHLARPKLVQMATRESAGVDGWRWRCWWVRWGS